MPQRKVNNCKRLLKDLAFLLIVLRNSSLKERCPPFTQIDLGYERSSFNQLTSLGAQLWLVHITTLPQLVHEPLKRLLRKLLICCPQYTSCFFKPLQSMTDLICVLTQDIVKWRKVILLGILKMVPVSPRRGDRNVMTPCEWCQSALWQEIDNEDL